MNEWLQEHAFTNEPNGHFFAEILKWAVNNGLEFEENLYECIAQYKQFKLLKSLVDKFNPPKNVRICHGAAKSGDLEIFLWARSMDFALDEEVCSIAAGAGHLEIIQVARSMGCPWDETTCQQAVAAGNFEILKWVRSEGCPWDEHIEKEADVADNEEIMDWIENVQNKN